MSRLGRGCAAEAHREERGDRHARSRCREQPRLAREPRSPRRGEHEHGRQHGEAGAEVAPDLPEVLEHRQRATKLLAVSADADVEPSREHEVGEPERDAEHGDGAEGPERTPQALPARDQDVHALRRKHERAVRMCRDRRQDRGRPEPPRAPPASVQRVQEGEVRERARAEEEAVHAPVDAVEEEDPAGRDEQRAEQRLHTAREPREQ